MYYPAKPTNKKTPFCDATNEVAFLIGQQTITIQLIIDKKFYTIIAKHC
jgi:hypothetical protein